MISVVLATYNEEKNIGRCLEAVESWADEIIVVDGNSPDKTKAVAKSFGARVISTTNKANFHINKQMAMDEAKGDLILQLDADEVVDEELRSFILQTEDARKNNALTEKAWQIPRKNLFLNHWLSKGGQYPDPVIRLYLRGAARLPQEDVHEQMKVDGAVGWARGHLLHYANPHFTEYVRKFNTYTSFRAQQWMDAGQNLSWQNTLRYCLWMPCIIFVSLFLRHRGYIDGFAGFIFAVMSGLHYPVAYIKLWEKQHTANQ